MDVGAIPPWSRGVAVHDKPFLVRHQRLDAHRASPAIVTVGPLASSGNGRLAQLVLVAQALGSDPASPKYGVGAEKPRVSLKNGESLDYTSIL